MAEQHQNLKEEVYSATTISLLKQLVPYEYLQMINKQVSMSLPSKEKILRIQAILDSEKDSTLNGIPDKVINIPKKSQSDNPKAQYGSKYGQNRQSQGQGHDCFSSSQCNTKWDKFGCIEVYKLTTVD